MTHNIESRQRARHLFVCSRYRQKPAFGSSYKRWLEDRFDYSVDNFGEVDFRSVSFALRKAFLASRFWLSFVGGRSLENLDREFLYRTQGALVQSLLPPSVGTKRFESFLRKTHRFNVRENTNWPIEPALGWVHPGNWFEVVNDIVRCQIIACDMNGARFLAEHLDKLASQHGHAKHDLRFLADDDGYYGIHFYTEIKTPVLIKSKGRISTIAGIVEIQITTAMQKTVKQLLHSDYRRKRNELREDEIPWQWRYRDDEFVLRFLGHSIQSIDGMACKLKYSKGDT